MDGQAVQASDPRQLLELALAAHRAGRLDTAEDHYRRVLQLSPDQPDALHLLGVAKRAQGELDQAIGLMRRALEQMPTLHDAWYNLGNALAAAGKGEEAEGAYERALELAPHYAEAAYNLGNLHVKAERPVRAEAAFEQALRADPGHLGARHNLGNLSTELGQFERGIARLREVVARAPALAEGHYNLAHALLRQGDWASGLGHYEHRWQTAGFGSERRHRDIPTFTGEPFDGRTLLVHAEQGLGDTLQFLRFLPLARPLGGAVVLELPAALVPLCRDVAGADRVVPMTTGPIAADLEVPLLSLPHRLGLGLGAVPAMVPNLRADPDRVHSWKQRLAGDPRPCVGLVWQGNAAAPIDRGRSLPSADLLAPLTSIGGVRLVALQKPGSVDIEPASNSLGWRVAGIDFEIEHPGPELDAGDGAFLDSAAIMASLELVVTTDTALAHLAGALARPTC